MTVGRGEFGTTRIAWMDAAHHHLVATEVLDGLGEQQARRFEVLTGMAARRFLATRWLARHLVAELTDDTSLVLTTTCRRCGGDHGQPRFDTAPVAVSFAYAGSVAVVAAASVADASAVGVDIEHDRGDDPALPLPELTSLFAPSRPPTLQEWTLIEAALKADGRGLTVELSQVEVGPSGFESTHPVWIPGRSDPVHAMEIDGPEGFILSAATVPAVAQSRHPD
ncbi:hypothetical protein LG299_13195 [Microbacterium lacus]|uniref:hypothetical protein n=1 Tax=Microbacterium lacus TaxID=415217 RepID=UPI003850AF04